MSRVMRSLLLVCGLLLPTVATAVVAGDHHHSTRMDWIDRGNKLKIKSQKLAGIKTRLKKRFVKIDEQIDRTVDILATWYMLPNAQVRPLIINLWGMTGVGKTSLVRAIVKELDMEGIFAEVDIGELVSAQHNFSGRHTPHPLWQYAYMSGKPMIWLLDEFHAARTVDERGMGNPHVALRPIMKLLSDGIVPVPTHKEYLLRLAQQMYENPGGNAYCEELPLEDLHRFVYPEKTLDWIRGEFRKKPGRIGLANYMLSHIPHYMPMEKEVDYRRSIVINAGNLDEAFQDVTEMDPLLMSADEFHEASKRVTVRRIKSSLVRRFKVEEIARLGNTHIIYPAFSEGAFRQLIELELSRLAEAGAEEVPIPITFTPAVTDLLYNEGVIPSQGARPPLTTVTDLVGSHLSSWLVEALTVEAEVSAINVDVKEGSQLVVTGTHAGKQAFRLESKLRLTAGDRLKVEPSLIQTRVAYREAAKAIVGMMAKGVLPISVYSKNMDSTPGGSVRFPIGQSFTKKDAMDQLQILLASREMERIKYDEDGISHANGPEIQSATELTGRMVQDWGMGGEHITQSSKLPCSTKFATNDAHQVSDGQTQNELLCTAASAAAQTLEKEKDLVAALGEHLSKNATITRPELIDLVRKHARDQKRVELILDGCGSGL